ncbi:2'-5' RNA ligase [Catalinimonas alkaloidigena]|uniref:2'-5' RNA ligase n=1 Tax=Catalinimonas alkaloidigena TaxID=1075417 RepID=A0A1G9ITC6_9BACT|nr:2'-5' RNA ligase family protein [Catalinimonas alkaloidigena]SDL28044.1 2'-5' RNA ligase [Catalinimonas alkaloidigena]
MPSTALHFLALVPPSPLQEEVTAFKREAARQFQTQRALRSPAHITLIPPFAWDDAEALAPFLRQFATRHAPFPVTLRNFAAFAPRVIYVDVVGSEALVALQQDLAQQMHAAGHLPLGQPDRPFHPHMTVAFRDLTRSKFVAAWAYFSTCSYERSFRADHLALLRHDAQKWHIIATYPLGPTSAK